MRTGRSNLRVLIIAGVLTLGATVGQSQDGQEDEAQANQAIGLRITGVAAQIQSRITNAKTTDIKKCLEDKKTKVSGLKSRVGAVPAASLASELDALAAEADACSGATSSSSSSANAQTGAQPAKVETKVDEGTPDPEDSDPSIIIAPGPTASGSGVVDDGTDTPDPVDPGTTPVDGPPIVPPPPVSPMM